MIDCHAAPTSNAQRVLLMLEECGLAYRHLPVALHRNEHRSERFLALNPVGAVPVIVDADGPGGQPLMLAQSGAILHYLARKSGRFHVPETDALRPLLDQWLLLVLTDLAAASSTLVKARLMGDPEGVLATVAEGQLKALLACVDRQLAAGANAAGTGYVVTATEPSLVDIALLPIVHAPWSQARWRDMPDLCALPAWYDRMMRRPASVRVLVPAAGA